MNSYFTMIETDLEAKESFQCAGTGDLAPTVQTSKKVCCVARTVHECFKAASARMPSAFSRTFMIACSLDTRMFSVAKKHESRIHMGMSNTGWWFEPL